MTSATNIHQNVRPALSAARPTNFFDTLASEWAKLISLRSTHITLGLGFALSVATTALVALALGSTQDSWSADFSPVTTSMVGNIFALIVYSVFGALAFSREYSTGMIRLTLAATPNRSRVFFAKILIIGVMIAVIGVATTVSMFLVGQAVLGAYGMPTATLADADAQRMVFGLGIGMAFFPLIGLALGVILRSSAGAITSVLGILWLPQIFGAIVPMWWQENILTFLPSNGIDSITISHIEPSPAFSDPWIGALITAGWLLGTFAFAYISFQRRDA